MSRIRGFLYGLGAAGEAGVDQMLADFGSEMKRTMALIGCANVNELDREFIR